MERLDKRLAATGRWSRKEARELIRAGRVAVDGTPCRAPEAKVDECAPVLVDGVAIGATGRCTSCSTSRRGWCRPPMSRGSARCWTCWGRSTGTSACSPPGGWTRTQRGCCCSPTTPLAHRLLSPRSHVDKVYYVEVDGVLDGADVQAARAGMTLGDGTACLPAELELLSGHSAHITLREGKYHQVKRMLASRGKPVTYLKRVRFGPLPLDEALPKGGWRPLNEEEREALFRH